MSLPMLRLRSLLWNRSTMQIPSAVRWASSQNIKRTDLSTPSELPSELWTPGSREYSQPVEQSSPIVNDDDNKDADAQPVKFSQNFKWHASMHVYPKPTGAPWYQPYMIALSLWAMLIYFGILREENSTDEWLYSPNPVMTQRIAEYHQGGKRKDDEVGKK